MNNKEIIKFPIKDFLLPKNQLYCKLCGRDKFSMKQPHNCIGGFRKRKIEWGYKQVVSRSKICHICGGENEEHTPDCTSYIYGIYSINN